MPSSTVQNPPVAVDALSTKKKKGKVNRTESPAPSASDAPDKAISIAGDDASSESPYVRELSKNIRNVTKKITNAAKTETLIAEHKDKTIDQLLAAKIINADQKSQALKKPQLEAQLVQLEEQLAQYKKVDEEYRTRGAADKVKLEKELTEKLEKEKADALLSVTEKAAADAKKLQQDSLLVLSQFLRLAAARRTEEADQTLDENMALEGVLLNVYSGDESAVATMVKLIEGSEEKTRSVQGGELQTSFAEVKALATAHGRLYASAESELEAPETSAPPAETETIPETDPTVAHAGLTELDTTSAGAPTTNGHAAEVTPSSGIPVNADVDDGAANAAGESQWDTSNDLSASVTQEGWVQVPRDPAETETGLTATPAAPGPVQSWADDQPEVLPEVPAQAADDGFHQVQRNRPRGQGEGWRGRGGRGEFRGRRGDGRGRGRGQGRGNFQPRGGQRGGRPAEQ